MENNLRIPKENRHSYAEPLDRLIAGTREDTIAQVENIFKDYIKAGLILNFYLVGDIVAQDFLSNEFLKAFVKICIIDEKTQRNQINMDFEGSFEEIVEFRNPAGTINKDCWEIFRNIINSNKKTLVKITEGEEDLLILPLILEIPIIEKGGNFAFYGQPPITDSKFKIPEGIVIVNVDKKIQEKVRRILSIMEKLS
ncbi:hypothetical protein LCGC14_0602890 [marine sediment metagenome]|uniref:DPCK n=1 Tax=marine sediment metagenome TaxID=412755 RepID=A0A0F9RA63_9ZZZZ|nr:MAG: hypothetical protein Lokiarch_42000 [Candidatus Lokiarchaeum sp. GC14_75]